MYIVQLNSPSNKISHFSQIIVVCYQIVSYNLYILLKKGCNEVALILAVDDARTMRELVRTVLEAEGHTVLTADDGNTGLELANEHSADLVITDLHMDEMDGITMTSKLRQMSDYKTTPILLLTTEQSDGKKTEGRIAGASGWLTKPFNPPRLVKAVNKLLDV